MRYVDVVKLTHVRPYIETDLRLGYKWKFLLLELVGRDLIHVRHWEQRSANATQVERSVFGRATVEI